MPADGARCRIASQDVLASMLSIRQLLYLHSVANIQRNASIVFVLQVRGIRVVLRSGEPLVEPERQFVAESLVYRYR